MSDPVTAAIRTILAEECPEIEPQDINQGNCEWFAEQVARRVPGALIVSDDYILHGHDGGSHSFVAYNGLFYDSECPQGTPDWGALPFFVRERNYAWQKRTMPAPKAKRAMPTPPPESLIVRLFRQLVKDTIRDGDYPIRDEPGEDKIVVGDGSIEIRPHTITHRTLTTTAQTPGYAVVEITHNPEGDPFEAIIAETDDPVVAVKAALNAYIDIELKRWADGQG